MLNFLLKLIKFLTKVYLCYYICIVKIALWRGVYAS